MPPRKVPDIGEKLGSLTFIGELEPIRRRNRLDHRGEFLCDCGNLHEANINRWRGGRVRACGCKNRTHGLIYTPIYNSWSSMQQRKRLPRYQVFDHDPRWNDFQTWHADVQATHFEGARQDRIDNDRGYWPDNVQWLTPSEHGKKTVSETNALRPLKSAAAAPIPAADFETRQDSA